MKNRANWQRENYAKYWVDQVSKYGFDDYCKGLLNLILSKKPSSVYELAIGTGWPFAISLNENGVAVAGSDISELLIQEIKNNYPNINVVAQTYEDIKPNQANQYCLVYCFRSSWYFPDIYKALDAMFMLVKEDGFVIFDIMNKDSDYIKNMIKSHRILFPYTILKNVYKTIMNAFFSRRYLVQSLWNIHEIPVSSKDIENYLAKKGVSFKKYSINQITDNINSQFKDIGISNSKIIFECQLKGK